MMVISATVGKVAPQVPKEFALTNKQMQSLSGRYVQITYRFPWQTDTDDTLTVSVKKNNLAIQFSDGEVRQLIPVTEFLFRQKLEPVATTAFIKRGRNLYLQLDEGNFKRQDN